MRHKAFYAVTLTGFVAGLGLKFLAHGVLRGAVYDVVLVAVLASATFDFRNRQLTKSAT